MKRFLLATTLFTVTSCNRLPAPDHQGSRAEFAGPTLQPAEDLPMMKQYQSPPSERLGTLPESVGVPVGSPAPNATVQDADGRDISLHALLKDGPVLLAFYRGGWCPFCNFQIRELTTSYPEFKRRGIRPIAISVDRATEAAKTRATYTIPFAVLADPDLNAHRAFQVVHQATEEEVARLKGFGMDIEKHSGRTHHVIAIPSLFVIDREGLVRWAHADPDYKVRPKTEQILAAIDALNLRAN